MIRSIPTFAAVLPFAALLLSACSVPSNADGAAPAAADDDLGTLQSVPWGAYTMTTSIAYDSLANDNADPADGHVAGSVTWTGSGTLKTGACLLNEVRLAGLTRRVVSCASDSDCASYATPYTGGSAHCRAPNNGSTKVCYVRPGPQSQFCVGSPATGTTVTVPTTLSTSAFGAFNYYRTSTHTEQDDKNGNVFWYKDTVSARWMMDGCYGGCSGLNGMPTTPSDSNAADLSSETDYDTSNGYSVIESATINAN